MAKNDWWFKFEHDKWMADERLNRCSLATQGFWLRCLCVMHRSGEYSISGTVKQLSRLLSVFPEEFIECCAELDETKTADVTECHANFVTSNDVVTITSRRLKRAVNDREQSRLRQRKHRNKTNVTEASQDRVRSKKLEVRKEEKKEEKKEKKKNNSSDTEFVQSLVSNPAYDHIDVMNEFAKAGTWCEVNNRQNTKRFFVNWLNRIQKPLPNQNGATNGQYKTKREKERDTVIDNERVIQNLEQQLQTDNLHDPIDADYKLLT